MVGPSLRSEVENVRFASAGVGIVGAFSPRIHIRAYMHLYTMSYVLY